MSESSAEVRLQVVHPVPAFFVFQKIFKTVFQNAPADSYQYRDFPKVKSSKRNLRFPFKKTGESETIFAAFSVHPEPNGRKVDKMLTLKKVKELVEHRCTVDCTPTCVDSDCAAVCDGICT